MADTPSMTHFTTIGRVWGRADSGVAARVKTCGAVKMLPLLFRNASLGCQVLRSGLAFGGRLVCAFRGHVGCTVPMPSAACGLGPDHYRMPILAQKHAPAGHGQAKGLLKQLGAAAGPRRIHVQPW